MSEAERGGASRRDESGRLLAGRYRLGGVLGRGGMGTVWRAQDETLGRTVAVKELRFPSSIDEDEKRRLITRTLREAKAIARIRNNGAVTVFDVVDEDDRPWIVMELIEGKSLAEVIREDGLLEPKRAAEVGLAILDVLRAAHREGILHRDVKPSNVLISKEDGRVVLTDFGIAQVEGDPSITSTGMLVGAPSYISPERARGHKPGPAADLWSLGGLLYASVEGVPPYDKGSAIATLTAVMTEPVPEPKSAGPLKDVIFGLLAKDPQQRLDDAGARVLLNDVIHAPEPKEPEPEPLDATRVVALPPVPEELSGKGSRGGSGSGAKQGEAAEGWRGALRSVRKAASGAVAGSAAAGTRGRPGGEESGSGAASSGADSGSGSGSGAKSGSASASASGSGSGSGSKSGSRPGSSPGSRSGSGSGSAGAAASSGVGSGAGKGAAAGTAVPDRSSDKAAGKSGVPSGRSGEAGRGTSGGKVSAGQSGAGDVAATKAVNTVAGGRTSGWPEMTPPDLPPRPVPRAPITDVVPRRTLVIVAVVVALVVVLGTVLALSLGGDDSTSGSKSGDTKSAAAGKATPSSGKDEDSGARTEAEKTGAATGTDASASGEASTGSGSDGSSGSGGGGDSSGSDGIAETTYKGSQGFSIGLPKGWKYQSTDAAGARFSGPDGQKLLVAWTSTPKNDPVADWKNQERYMKRPQYQRIRIEEVDYRGWKTADWEFTYTDGGTKYRSIDRGFVVNSQQGYALMYTAKASEWRSDLRRDTWRTFTKTFQPKS